MKIFFALFLCVNICLLTACGSDGPLYLPKGEKKVQTQAEQATAQQPVPPLKS